MPGVLANDMNPDPVVSMSARRLLMDADVER
jgi:hypothetical protein